MPKVVDHDQRRRHIIDVTWDLIITGGIEAATMREIASSAGFANGALKHYYASKDDIIEATFDRALSLMEDYVELGDRRGLAALHEVCSSSMPLDNERIVAGRVLITFWNAALSNPKLHERYQEHLGSWRNYLHRFIAEAREDGDITTETPDEQLVDEIVLLTAGANVMGLVGERFWTVEMQRRHLESFFARLT